MDARNENGESSSQVKGFVLTPPGVVDLMVEKLFSGSRPSESASLLDPGCGTGAFIDGVIRWCAKNAAPLPSTVGIDLDPSHVSACRKRFANTDRVTIRQADFLLSEPGRYDFIVGNPPYVPITALSHRERDLYRGHYATATNRFDLYLLFFEQALRLLKPTGRLVFITPEKFLYVTTAAPLRRLLASTGLEQLHFLDESTFGELITYPLVTTVAPSEQGKLTDIQHRDGTVNTAQLPVSGASWLPAIRGSNHAHGANTLADISIRVSCGVATGADSVFVVKNSHLSGNLRPFAHPTIAGRHIGSSRRVEPSHSLLLPYATDGTLLPESSLGSLGDYLSEPKQLDKLLARTCVARKPWYAFHETPPMRDLLRPKLLCKDIGANPFFVVDDSAQLIPRHSVYYVVPADPTELERLAEYLNSSVAQQWLHDHCQRAAGGFIRLQSHVLKHLPVPADFAPFQDRILFRATAT